MTGRNPAENNRQTGDPWHSLRLSLAAIAVCLCGLLRGACIRIQQKAELGLTEARTEGKRIANRQIVACLLLWF